MNEIEMIKMDCRHANIHDVLRKKKDFVLLDFIQRDRWPVWPLQGLIVYSEGYDDLALLPWHLQQ